MKFKTYTKDGRPVEDLEIPDDILESANRVRAWMESRYMKTGCEIIKLCGLTLLETREYNKSISHWGIFAD